MKKNKLPIILVILLGGLSFWFIIHNHKGTIDDSLKNFAVVDTAAINKIFLADKKGNEVTLERQPSGIWTVNGKYNARMDAVKTLLYTIKKVAVKEPVGKIAQDNVVKRLAGKAVRCEIYQNNELVKAYYVGTETQDQEGTFMILINLETMKAADKPFINYIPGFVGYLTTRYFTEEAGWRDRTVYQYVPSDIRSVKLETPFNPEFGYELIVKAENNYQVKMLSDGKNLENVDPIAVKQYLSYFQQLNFESFEVNLNKEQIDSVLKSQAINILTVIDKNGTANKVKFFARKPKQEGLIDVNGKPIVFDPDRMDALLDNGKDFVMLQYFSWGKVMPPAYYFQKNPQQGQPEPNKAKNKPKA